MSAQESNGHPPPDIRLLVARKSALAVSHCYAERMAKRLQAMGQPNYVNGFKLSMHEHVLEKPLEWKTPQIIFVNSMSDLFHKDVPLEFIQRVFDVMKRAHWHQFQVLAKRSERLAKLSPLLEWAENIWMGVSVENKDYVYRIDDLRKTGAKIKFLSVEPLLGPMPKMNLKRINWVIVGGVGSWRASVGEGVGGRRAGSVQEGESPFLFQAVGRNPEEEDGKVARWQDVG